MSSRDTEGGLPFGLRRGCHKRVDRSQARQTAQRSHIAMTDGRGDQAARARIEAARGRSAGAGYCSLSSGFIIAAGFAAGLAAGFFMAAPFFLASLRACGW